MLLALLLPDPCDELCPAYFITEARKALLAHHGRAAGWQELVITNEGLRRVLLDFIGNAANWDNSTNASYLETGRSLIKAAYSEELPLVVDPFSGGGSIPLEALRLGVESFASDLNPVSCLLLKVMLEDIPRDRSGLADELRRLGGEIRKEAEKELVNYYPRDLDEAIPIAYLWARTVRCESPNCGAEIPIYRSPWLSKKGVSKARYFKEAEEGDCIALLVKSAPKGGPISFRIARGLGSENDRQGYIKLAGTKAPGNNANAICPCCGSLLPGTKSNPRIPFQLSSQRGGADVILDQMGNRIGGATLLAVVTVKRGERGRHYRLPTDRDYQAVWLAEKRLGMVLDSWKATGENGLCPVPDEPLPPIGTLGFRVQRYGMLSWGDLFTSRQKIALIDLLGIIHRFISNFENGIAESLACAFSRVAMSGMSCTRWNSVAEKMQHTFGRQALPIVWDFAEVVPVAPAPGNWESGYDLVADMIDSFPSGTMSAQVQQEDAASSPLPDSTCQIWFTDPPYYDAVPYADLSDFFFVWLKRVLKGHALLRDRSDPLNPLTPKTAEIVQNQRSTTADGHSKDREFYEEAMAIAFAEGRRVLSDDGVGCVVFAHKTTEGWEALLSGMIRGGWTITGSWPIATEMGSRLRARESAALATSIHLVCRPRPEGASVGDWSHVLRELPKRIGDWMERLQREGIRGADLGFACIGPALEIFSRYRKVETADGSEVRLAEYLEKVWEVVGRTALEQVLGSEEARARNGVAGALEEDARLTGLFLWTLQSTNGEAAPSTGTDEAEEEETDDDEEETASKGKAKGFSLMFDVVRRFAQPLGIGLPKWEDRIIQTEKGVVRLIAVSERAKQLFGEKGMTPVVEEIEASKSDIGQLLLPGLEEFVVSRAPKKTRDKRVKFAVDDPSEIDVSATTLDRVHAAMLLQAAGQSNALRAFIKAEVERGPDFLRLANALSALYPKGSEEKRLLDAMLLAVPR